MKRRLANILIFLLPALLALRVGLLALGHGLVDWSALSAAAHAFDVFHRLPQANMALIGFVQPPLPALLLLPSAYLFPTLQHHLAIALVGALFLGFSTVMLAHLGQDLRLRWWLYLPVTALFACHPLVLSYAALGHPAIILIFTYIGMAKGLTGWHREQKVRDLIAAAIYGAVAILVAYEAVVPVLAAALFILQRCRRDASSPGRAEGTLITFLLPAAYVAGVWLVANWTIMGDPLHFWRMTVAGTAGVPVSPVDSWLQPVLTVAFTVQPLLLALVYTDLRPVYGPRQAELGRAGTAVAWLALAALLSPLLFATLRSQATGGAMWAPLMPLAAASAAFGFPLLLTLLASLQGASAEGRRRLLSAGFVIIAAASLVVGFHLQSNQMGLPAGVRSTLRGYPAGAHTSRDEQSAAVKLAALLEQARSAEGAGQYIQRNYIAGWPGFAIALYGQSTRLVEVLPGSEPPAGDLGLQAGSALVLLGNGHDSRLAWQARLPRFLGLQAEWTAGKWTGYRVVVKRQ